MNPDYCLITNEEQVQNGNRNMIKTLRLSSGRLKTIKNLTAEDDERQKGGQNNTNVKQYNVCFSYRIHQNEKKYIQT